MITWVSIVTWNGLFFLYIGKHLSYNDVIQYVSVSISSRILFLCVINEIIMKVKLIKILFLNLCFGCVFFMRSLVCKARHR
jgi:hypothetical protein